MNQSKIESFIWGVADLIRSGSGGMLTIAKEQVTQGVQRDDELLRDPIVPKAEVHLFGQEAG